MPMSLTKYQNPFSGMYMAVVHQLLQGCNFLILWGFEQPQNLQNREILKDVLIIILFNTLASGWFWRFSQKKQQFLVALPTP